MHSVGATPATYTSPGVILHSTGTASRSRPLRFPRGRFVGLLDRHTSSLMTFRMSNSWFTLRADELGVLMLTVIGAVVLLVPGASAAEAGLILSLVYDTILIMPFLVMMCSELAAMLSAVDRCTEYCKVRRAASHGVLPGER